MNGMVNPNMMNPGMRGMMNMNNGMQVLIQFSFFSKLNEY